MDNAGEAAYYKNTVRGKAGIWQWIFSTDHKRIGILYLFSALAMFMTGAALGLLMRLEFLTPGPTIMGPQTYNAMFTLHGVIMIFLFIIPVAPGVFGNFFLPILIGANDVAFPRLNLFSWWLYVAGAVLALGTLLFGAGPPDTGWTFYAPYSLLTGQDVSLAVFAVFVLGLSSVLTGINFIVTVHNMRAPGMGWFRMPLFVWSIYATAWIQALATPVVGTTFLLVIAERFFGIGVFDPAKGGDPILYQHLFWIYSHPAVYIMILPAMGIITEIIPVFARKTVFGYRAIAYSSLAIAGVGSLVWGHHMFVSGYSYTAGVLFSFFTFLVAIPSAVKVFNWIATMHKGSIVFSTPMLYALCFIFLFSIGGLSGLMLGALSMNVVLHGTYFVVGHFHYVKFGGAGLAFFAGLHYWFPKMTGRFYSRMRANAALLSLFVGFNMLYFPMFILGIEGMPRRYFDALPRYHFWQAVSIAGSWVLAAGLILMLANLVHALFRGEKASENPWGGATLEWTIPSPPARENFVKIPEIKRGPYDYR